MHSIIIILPWQLPRMPISFISYLTVTSQPHTFLSHQISIQIYLFIYSLHQIHNDDNNLIYSSILCHTHRHAYTCVYTHTSGSSICNYSACPNLNPASCVNNDRLANQKLEIIFSFFLSLFYWHPYCVAPLKEIDRIVKMTGRTTNAKHYFIFYTCELLYQIFESGVLVMGHFF